MCEPGLDSAWRQQQCFPSPCSITGIPLTDNPRGSAAAAAAKTAAEATAETAAKTVAAASETAENCDLLRFLTMSSFSRRSSRALPGLSRSSWRGFASCNAQVWNYNKSLRLSSRWG